MTARTILHKCCVRSHQFQWLAPTSPDKRAQQFKTIQNQKTIDYYYEVMTLN